MKYRNGIIAAAVVAAGLAGIGAVPHLLSGPESADASAAYAGRMGEPVFGAVPHVTNRTHVTLPLDAYRGSMADIKLISTARNVAARNCMWTLGFKDWKTDTVETSTPGSFTDFDLLNYLDPAAVAAHGYPQTLLDKGGDQPTVKAQSATAAKPVTPEELSAYTGAPAKGNVVARSATTGKIPPGGCAGQGDREITGASDLPASARSLAADIMFAARDDSRVQKVFAQWSLCMSGKGFRYHSPLDAQIDPRWGRRTASTPATGAEKQTATADAQCQQQANVVGIYKATEAAYQQPIITHHRQELVASKAIFAKWVSAAKAELARP